MKIDASKYPVGKKNVYTCQSCGARCVTIDRDAGTTPFMIACHNCPGNAISSFYNVDQSLHPSHEWYRMSDKEIAGKPQGWKSHHDMGGLFLRPIQ